VTAPSARDERREEVSSPAVTADAALDWAWDSLGEVMDPELGLDIVTLGLVYDVRLDESTVVVEMTLTTPGCPASQTLPMMAHDALAQSDPRAIDVRVVWDPPWSPRMIDEDAARAMGFSLRYE